MKPPFKVSMDSSEFENLPFCAELNARCDVQKTGAEHNFKGLSKSSHNSQVAIVKVQPFEHHSV
jgi:hypothetical protein